MPEKMEEAISSLAADQEALELRTKEVREQTRRMSESARNSLDGPAEVA